MKTRAPFACLLVLVVGLGPSPAHGGSSPDPRGLASAAGWAAASSRVGEGLQVTPPRIVTRREWGAEESLRFQGRRERRAPSFAPVRKLIIHHTATRRSERPGKAIRSIYRSHTVARGFADIAYHYLVASDGTVFKGRYSGPPGTRRQDRRWADKWERWGVKGAHTLAANDGTIGIALLGNYEKRPLSPEARGSLVSLLAWLSDRYGIDPVGSSRYPRSSGMVLTRNITGHGSYGSTACPGKAVERELPEIRREVARRLRGAVRLRPDVHGPLIHEVRTPRVGRRGALVRWRTDEPARSIVAVRPERGGARRTAVRRALTTEHLVHLGPLRRDTAYVFRLGGMDSEGNTAWSAPHSLRTRR